MGIILRYILRELGTTFLVGFVVFTGLLLIVGVIRQAMEEDLPWLSIVQIIPFIFAEMCSISLPVSLLLAVTIFFSRISGNNEIVALKALGIPPSAFLVPVFVIALIISVIGFRINELAITEGRQGISAVIYYSAEDILIKKLKRTQRFDSDDNQITILVQGVDDQRLLIKPTIILKRESITIEAETAQITIDFQADSLKVDLVDVRLIGAISGRFPHWYHEITLSEFVPKKADIRPSNMGLNKIKEEQEKTEEQMGQQRRVIAAHRTFAAVMGSVDAWRSPEMTDAQAKMRSLQNRLTRLSVEPPRRWATGFCCFFFVWLGAPVSIWLRKPDFFSSFFACFLPILILYYPLFMFGLDQAKNGALPPICVWTANAAIGLIGLWFLRQIHRY